MGIIDSKENIFDILLSDIGLENLATKGLNITYYTFSDAEISYDNINLEDFDIDASKLSIEPSKLLSDSALPVLNTHNQINDKILNSKFVNGNIYINGVLQNNSIDLNTLINTSTQLYQNINNDFISKSSLFNFNDDFEDIEFKLNTGSIVFTISGSLPIPNSIKNINITDIRNFLQDLRLNNQLKTKRLDPILNKNRKNGKKIKLDGSEISSEQENLNVNQFNNSLIQKLNFLKSNGFSKRIDFDLTSINNNLILQAFSFTNQNCTNLSIIDLGNIFDKRILMIGKIFYKYPNSSIPINDTSYDLKIYNNKIFRNIFTLVFQK